MTKTNRGIVGAITATNKIAVVLHTRNVHTNFNLNLKAQTPSSQFTSYEIPTSVGPYKSYSQRSKKREDINLTMATAAMAEKKKERPSALRSIIAGSTAGAVEIGTFFLLLRAFMDSLYFD